MLLNYVLPKNGINKEISWFIFVYPTEAGGLGALIAFVISSVIGQALKFITNFKKTFKSTNNILLSAIGFAVMAVIIVVGLNLYVGGLLNTALCKVIPNADLAGTIAKAVCQMAGFLLAFPVNKFILMRNKPADKEQTQPNP
jgi:putative flippase GtrA